MAVIECQALEKKQRESVLARPDIGSPRRSTSQTDIRESPRPISTAEHASVQGGRDISTQQKPVVISPERIVTPAAAPTFNKPSFPQRSPASASAAPVPPKSTVPKPLVTPRYSTPPGAHHRIPAPPTTQVSQPRQPISRETAARQNSLMPVRASTPVQSAQLPINPYATQRSSGATSAPFSTAQSTASYQSPLANTSASFDGMSPIYSPEALAQEAQQAMYTAALLHQLSQSPTFIQQLASSLTQQPQLLPFGQHLPLATNMEQAAPARLQIPTVSAASQAHSIPNQQQQWAGRSNSLRPPSPRRSFMEERLVQGQRMAGLPNPGLQGHGGRGSRYSRYNPYTSNRHPHL